MKIKLKDFLTNSEQGFALKATVPLYDHSAFAQLLCRKGTRSPFVSWLSFLFILSCLFLPKKKNYDNFPNMVMSLIFNKLYFLNSLYNFIEYDSIKCILILVSPPYTSPGHLHLSAHFRPFPLCLFRKRQTNRNRILKHETT